MPTNQTDRPLVVVVGHLVKDEITSAEGHTSVALGGIAYNMAALCCLMKTGRIYPICRIGTDIRYQIANIFGGFPVFDDSGIMYSNRPNIVNRLVYNHDGTRQEWNSGKPGSLDIENIPINADAVIFNFISGNDVKLSELIKFRKRYRGLIYVDFHSLSLGRDGSGGRYLRYHPRWREYLSVANIAQMNVAELSTIARRELSDNREVAKAARILNEAGPAIVVITMGERGVIFSDREKDEQYYIPAIHIDGRTDPTGCGDTLAAAFAYHVLRKNDLIKSIEMANHYAAAKATFTGLDGFGRIDDIMKLIGPAAKGRRI